MWSAVKTIASGKPVLKIPSANQRMSCPIICGVIFVLGKQGRASLDNIGAK